MYHIKSDKRSIKSAELIYAGLLKCLAEKPLAKITVTDVEKASTVSRATFYRHFDSIADVLYWQCDCCFRQLAASYTPPQGAAMPYHFIKYFFEFWFANFEILEILMQNNKADFIFACHVKNLKILTDKMPQNCNAVTEHYDYFIGIRAGLMIGVLTVWLEKGKKETPEELLGIICRQMDFFRAANPIV